MEKIILNGTTGESIAEETTKKIILKINFDLVQLNGQ